MTDFPKDYHQVHTRIVSFQILALSFILLFIPIVSVTMRGYRGFIPLLSLGILAFIVSGFRRHIIFNIGEAISQNKLLFFFIIWYFIASIANHIWFLNFSNSWSLYLSKITFLLGIFFAFGYISNASTLRYFQILLSLVMGIQAVFTIPYLISHINSAREMYSITEGAWIYGHPGYYAISIVILPCMLARAFEEKGRLRAILIISACAVIVMCSISSFGTPLGLLLLGILFTMLLLFGTIRTWQNGIKLILIFGLTYLIISLLFNRLFENPLLELALERIENLINNPLSGGYTGRYSDEGSRVYLATKSFNQFKSNPLFGGGGGTIVSNPILGGHSSFFDMLGAYGLFGGAGAYIGIVLITLVTTGRNYFKTKSWKSILIFTSAILYTIVGIVNPYWEGLGFVMFFIMARPFKQYGLEQELEND